MVDFEAVVPVVDFEAVVPVVDVDPVVPVVAGAVVAGAVAAAGAGVLVVLAAPVLAACLWQPARANTTKDANRTFFISFISENLVVEPSAPRHYIQCRARLMQAFSQSPVTARYAHHGSRRKLT